MEFPPPYGARSTKQVHGPKKNGQVQKTCTGPKKGAQVKKTCVPKMVASPMQGMSILKGEDNIFMYLQLLGISGLSKWLFKSIDEAAVPQKNVWGLRISHESLHS